MANELNIALSTGLTVTAQRYQAGASVGSAISLTEVSTSGFYTGNMTGSTGTYQLVFLASGATVGTGQIVWDGTAEVAPSTLTAPQVRTELSTELGRIDAAISSRLAPSGTLATVTTLTNAPTVPTAAAIADEVRVELATELGRIDAPVSSASAPTASTVATAVRTELTAELAKVSALNTDRLAQCSTVATTGSQLAAALS